MKDSQGIQRIKLADQLNNGNMRKTSYVNVTEEGSAQNLLNYQFYQHIQQCRMGQKVRTEGGMRNFSQVSQRRSNFSNYVCQELLHQIEKPAKTMSLEEKMSNPASTQAVKARASTIASKATITTLSNTGKSDMLQNQPQVEQRAMKRFLEDYYKRPIAINALR